MSEGRSSSFFWFLIGMIIGGGLVFFLATREGKRILSRLNLDDQEIERIKKFFEDSVEEKQVEMTALNGRSSNQEFDVGKISELENKNQIFGHRFFKKKRTP